MPAKQQHAHKLKRVRYKSGNSVFFCTLPDCNYKTNTPLALGKRALCWRCGNEFIMNEYSIRLAKPHCLNCHQPKFGNDGHVQNVENGKEESLLDRLQKTIQSKQSEVLEDEI